MCFKIFNNALLWWTDCIDFLAWHVFCDVRIIKILRKISFIINMYRMLHRSET